MHREFLLFFILKNRVFSLSVGNDGLCSPVLITSILWYFFGVNNFQDFHVFDGLSSFLELFWPTIHVGYCADMHCLDKWCKALPYHVINETPWYLTSYMRKPCLDWIFGWKMVRSTSSGRDFRESRGTHVKQVLCAHSGPCKWLVEPVLFSPAVSNIISINACSRREMLRWPSAAITGRNYIYDFLSVFQVLSQ